MKLSRALPLVGLLAAACGDATPTESPLAPSFGSFASGLARVTSSADDGAGSLRSAIAEANADPSIRVITFVADLDIQLLSSVVLSGTQELALRGRRTTLDGSALPAGETNFLATGGGDLEVSGVTFRDAPGHGMIVQVPPTASGTQKVVLRDVSALDNLGHGVEINDQEDPDDAGDPDNGVRGNSNGSDASLEVIVTHSTFAGNGFGALDRDGLRINEGGLGDLTVSIFDTRADANGADGVELDERGAGDSRFSIFRSHFSRNGDFDQSADPDKDDGFDADEVDEGDMIVSVMLSTANDNFEEGFDFNENDAGDLRVFMKLSEASRNPEEGIDLEEDDDWQGGGDLVVDMQLVTANENGGEGDGGIKIRERGDGGLIADLGLATASGNESAGIHMREQQAGDLQATVRSATTRDNGAEGIFLREDDEGNHRGTVQLARAEGNGAFGIDFDENGDGDLAASVALASVANNVDGTVRADEGGNGTGTLTLKRVTPAGGTGGNVPPTP